jgi:hypothetical protein
VPVQQAAEHLAGQRHRTGQRRGLDILDHPWLARRHQQLAYRLDQRRVPASQARRQLLIRE